MEESYCKDGVKTIIHAFPYAQEEIKIIDGYYNTHYNFTTHGYNNFGNVFLLTQ